MMPQAFQKVVRISVFVLVPDRVHKSLADNQVAFQAAGGLL